MKPKRKINVSKETIHFLYTAMWGKNPDMEDIVWLYYYLFLESKK